MRTRGIAIRAISVGVPAALLAALAGCGPNYSPNTYSATAVQQANKVEQGVVVGVRQIDITSPGTTGAVVGAAAGGIAGSTAADGVGSALTALGGSVVGGILGSTAEKKLNDTFGFEYIVRKANGDLVSVTQKDEAPLTIGLHVLVIAGPQARIVPDYTVPIEIAKPPTAAGADPAVAKPAAPPTPTAPDASPASDVAPSAVKLEPPIEIKPLQTAPLVIAPPLPEELPPPSFDAPSTKPQG
jgi:outer membrane lipoprotein SlyB